MRFIDRFDAILLDLNGTFMFGHDRYGPGVDYYATYVSNGGSRLGREAVQDAITRCHTEMNRDYHDPDLVEDYPSLLESVREYSGADEADFEDLARVFSDHERGQVPKDHAEAIRSLAGTHRLGIVSNLWAPPEDWRAHLEEIGIGAAFTCTVFSSEGRTIKPSPEIFRRALAAFGSEARVLFVGDSLERDMIPAKALGMGTAWITSSRERHASVDVMAPSLIDLLSR